MALQRTAHDACSRKVHCVKKGYLDDPFVSFFTKDSTIVNSPLMNRGTWLRTTAIESAVVAFSEQHQKQPIQVISFGAGVDTLFFRLRKDHPDVLIERFVELDLADLVLEKHAIVTKHNALCSHIGPEYRLLAADLRSVPDVMATLAKNAVPGVPTVLLAEMVFVYLEESITTELLRCTMKDFLGNAAKALLITYDAMRPDDRFGQMMCENLRHFGVDLKGIHALPTPEAHAARCRQVGFQTVQALSMRQLYLTVPKEIQSALQNLEMVDDWDEWNLMHDHYCFLIASTEDSLPSITFSLRK